MSLWLLHALPSILRVLALRDDDDELQHKLRSAFSIYISSWPQL